MRLIDTRREEKRTVMKRGSKRKERDEKEVKENSGKRDGIVEGRKGKKDENENVRSTS